MRRVYKKSKKPGIREKALEQLRKTKAHIDASNPDLLERMRDQIERQVWDELPDDYSVKIDRKKNLEAVMMFMEMKKAHTPQFQSQLKDILKDVQIN